jgi:hypothetical protein
MDSLPGELSLKIAEMSNNLRGLRTVNKSSFNTYRPSGQLAAQDPDTRQLMYSFLDRKALVNLGGVDSQHLHRTSQELLRKRSKLILAL